MNGFACMFGADFPALFASAAMPKTPEPMDYCDVCHEPRGDECACQHEYRREHDAGAER